MKLSEAIARLGLSEYPFAQHDLCVVFPDGKVGLCALGRAYAAHDLERNLPILKEEAAQAIIDEEIDKEMWQIWPILLLPVDDQSAWSNETIHERIMLMNDGSVESGRETLDEIVAKVKAWEAYYDF